MRLVLLIALENPDGTLKAGGAREAGRFRLEGRGVLQFFAAFHRLFFWAVRSSARKQQRYRLAIRLAPDPTDKPAPPSTKPAAKR